MRKVSHHGKLLALIFDEDIKPGTIPLTPPMLPLQVIGLNHPKGRIWPPHLHSPKQRTTSHLQEVLFVLRGRISAHIQDGDVVLAQFELAPGEGVMVLAGALRMEALEDVRLLEFKNGPFIEDKIILTDVIGGKP